MLSRCDGFNGISVTAIYICTVKHGVQNGKVRAFDYFKIENRKTRSLFGIQSKNFNQNKRDRPL